MDLPTEKIPRHLRALGSRFLVIWQSVRPEPNDTLEELRAAAHAVTVQALPTPDDDRS